MAKKIYKITHQLTGREWYYTSIVACLENTENPINITQRRWSQIVRQKGYPFEHSECTVEQVFALSAEDVRGHNQRFNLKKDSITHV